MSERFPVLTDDRDRRAFPECPRSIPWERIAPHEAQARYNHDQTLQQLAERGGLCPGEIRCAVECQKLFDRPWTKERQAEDVAWLVAWLGEG